VLAAGLLMPGGDAAPRVRRIRAGQGTLASVFEDGGSVARSPDGAARHHHAADQPEANVYAARAWSNRRRSPAALARMVHRAARCLSRRRGLSSWQGGGPVSGDVIDQVIEARGACPSAPPGARMGLSAARRRQRRADHGRRAAAVARLVEGGCASTLAFELSDGRIASSSIAAALRSANAASIAPRRSPKACAPPRRIPPW
jgi:hypothetical protein